MMLREVLLKEDLHHMMSIDDGNFPGDDIIPMSQLFTDDEKEKEKEQGWVQQSSLSDLNHDLGRFSSYLISHSFI